jgi:hypothetical protein
MSGRHELVQAEGKEAAVWTHLHLVSRQQKLPQAGEHRLAQALHSFSSGETLEAAAALGDRGDREGEATATEGQAQDRIQQSFQCRIHTGSAHQHSAATTLAHHLQGNGASGFGNSQRFWCGMVHPSRSSTNSEQVVPLVISR